MEIQSSRYTLKGTASDPFPELPWHFHLFRTNTSPNLKRRFFFQTAVVKNILFTSWECQLQKKQATKTPGFCWLFKTWNKLHMNNLNQVVSIQPKKKKHNIGCFLLSSPPGLSLLHHFCGLQFRVVGGQDLTITALSLRTKGHRWWIKDYLNKKQSCRRRFVYIAFTLFWQNLWLSDAVWAKSCKILKCARQFCFPLTFVSVGSICGHPCKYSIQNQKYTSRL